MFTLNGHMRWLALLTARPVSGLRWRLEPQPRILSGPPGQAIPDHGNRPTAPATTIATASAPCTKKRHAHGPYTRLGSWVHAGAHCAALALRAARRRPTGRRLWPCSQSPALPRDQPGRASRNQHAGAADLLDLLLGERGEELGLDDYGLLRQLALAKHLEDAVLGDVDHHSRAGVLGGGQACLQPWSWHPPCGAATESGPGQTHDEPFRGSPPFPCWRANRPCVMTGVHFQGSCMPARGAGGRKAWRPQSGGPQIASAHMRVQAATAATPPRHHAWQPRSSAARSQPLNSASDIA